MSMSSKFIRPESPATQPASSTEITSGSSVVSPVPRRLLLWLTYGAAGTVLFPIIYVILGATRPGYDPWRQSISALSLGPGGWVQQLNFVLCGVSVLWMAFVWRKILAGDVCATWYPIIRGIEGLGLIAIGIFSTDPGYGYPPGTPSGPGHSTLGGTLHLIFTSLILNVMCLGLFVIARRFWKNPEWRGWTAFSVICGLLPIVFIPFFVIGQNNQTAFSGYAGLFERLATNADTLWTVVLLVRLWARRSASL
jgi:Protein of unknown function (DUF998)